MPVGKPGQKIAATTISGQVVWGTRGEADWDRVGPTPKQKKKKGSVGGNTLVLPREGPKIKRNRRVSRTPKRKKAPLSGKGRDQLKYRLGRYEKSRSMEIKSRHIRALVPTNKKDPLTNHRGGGKKKSWAKGESDDVRHMIPRSHQISRVNNDGGTEKDARSLDQGGNTPAWYRRQSEDEKGERERKSPPESRTSGHVRT